MLMPTPDVLLPKNETGDIALALGVSQRANVPSAVTMFRQCKARAPTARVRGVAFLWQQRNIPNISFAVS